MIQKLRLKFVCITMLIVLSLMIMMLSLVMTYTRSQLKEDSLQMMRSAISGPLKPPRPDADREERKLPYFRLKVDSDGSLVSLDDSYYDLSDRSTLEELVRQVGEIGTESGVIREYNLRFLTRNTPSGQVTIFLDISSETRVLSHLFTICILIGLAGFVVFLVLSILFARWAVKPVEQAWEKQKRFVGDASHELKTPLTVILTNVDLLQSENCDPQDHKRFLSSIKTMGEQMRGLIEEMLSLTRVDNPNLSATTQTVDLSVCVSDAVLPFEPVFYEAGLSVETDIDGGVFVRGDEKHLRQVVEIFLDNARKYSVPSSVTSVRLRTQGHNTLLTVENHGEEIGKEDLENIFLRFYRRDEARSMDHSYGLGLAIAKQIIENHHGKIWAESQDGLNSFHVSLTRTTAPKT